MHNTEFGVKTSVIKTLLTVLKSRGSAGYVRFLLLVMAIRFCYMFIASASEASVGPFTTFRPALDRAVAVCLPTALWLGWWLASCTEPTQNMQPHKPPDEEALTSLLLHVKVEVCTAVRPSPLLRGTSTAYASALDRLATGLQTLSGELNSTIILSINPGGAAVPRPREKCNLTNRWSGSSAYRSAPPAPAPPSFLSSDPAFAAAHFAKPVETGRAPVPYPRVGAFEVSFRMIHEGSGDASSNGTDYGGGLVYSKLQQSRWPNMSALLRAIGERLKRATAESTSREEGPAAASASSSGLTPRLLLLAGGSASATGSSCCACAGAPAASAITSSHVVPSSQLLSAGLSAALDAAIETSASVTGLGRPAGDAAAPAITSADVGFVRGRRVNAREELHESLANAFSHSSSSSSSSSSPSSSMAAARPDAGTGIASARARAAGTAAASYVARSAALATPSHRPPPQPPSQQQHQPSRPSPQPPTQPPPQPPPPPPPRDASEPFRTASGLGIPAWMVERYLLKSPSKSPPASKGAPKRSSPLQGLRPAATAPTVVIHASPRSHHQASTQ